MVVSITAACRQTRGVTPTRSSERPAPERARDAAIEAAEEVAFGARRPPRDRGES
jgi:hypothetical protein